MEVVVGVVRGVVVVGGARATNTTPKSKHEGNTKWFEENKRLCDNNGIKSLEYAHYYQCAWSVLFWCIKK